MALAISASSEGLSPPADDTPRPQQRSICIALAMPALSQRLAPSHRQSIQVFRIKLHAGLAEKLLHFFTGPRATSLLDAPTLRTDREAEFVPQDAVLEDIH